MRSRFEVRVLLRVGAMPGGQVLPAWLSYVKIGSSSALAQLPLTYDGASIPLAFPYTTPSDGPTVISILDSGTLATLDNHGRVVRATLSANDDSSPTASATPPVSMATAQTGMNAAMAMTTAAPAVASQSTGTPASPDQSAGDDGTDTDPNAGMDASAADNDDAPSTDTGSGDDSANADTGARAASVDVQASTTSAVAAAQTSAADAAAVAQGSAAAATDDGSTDTPPAVDDGTGTPSDQPAVITVAAQSAVESQAAQAAPSAAGQATSTIAATSVPAAAASQGSSVSITSQLQSVGVPAVIVTSSGGAAATVTASSTDNPIRQSAASVLSGILSSISAQSSASRAASSASLAARTSLISSSSSSARASGQGARLSTGGIAGVSVSASLALVALCLSLLICALRRKKRSKRQQRLRQSRVYSDWYDRYEAHRQKTSSGPPANPWQEREMAIAYSNPEDRLVQPPPRRSSLDNMWPESELIYTPRHSPAPSPFGSPLLGAGRIADRSEEDRRPSSLPYAAPRRPIAGKRPVSTIYEGDTPIASPDPIGDIATSDTSSGSSEYDDQRSDIITPERAKSLFAALGLDAIFPSRSNSRAPSRSGSNERPRRSPDHDQDQAASTALLPARLPGQGLARRTVSNENRLQVPSAQGGRTFSEGSSWHRGISHFPEDHRQNFI
ncbi:uncharacterized protein L969DRAFT_51461 [Mixia osmundae IAM 14324]|uniref:Uncharacterized protein n=1 Tax=Mixia osmundae (strain CBS 9802 / IAM 14324 / JCM 22182 / KY 12970) TaxID=764103 RepID=G7E7S6_MIXOS|nr:uncharacterized protein L969DRAFT_51461 [Mixia osmundae IAM 14324]KEI38487.1 hypothetical protein L969DRAFT_51461 [Mixia osmundae IAM 14324]GAA98886.1 hypothetical protein E5Q_05574 [Mixia osmundae IAM 14324]